MTHHTVLPRFAPALLLTLACAAAAAQSDRWTAAEIDELSSLWLGSLDALAPDPTNRYADEPAAVTLGHRLFFDNRLSSNGQVSCATCHLPGSEFQDGTPLARGVGTTDRRTMPIAGTAYSSFLFWDGRKDSQWAQALGPLESPVEHGGSRALYAHVVAEQYRAEYEALFGPLPELATVPRHAGPVADPLAHAAWTALSDEQREAVTGVFVNIGKAIAAYERRIQFGESRFDRYVAGLLETGRAPEGVLTADEVAGLRLFIGKANCTQCHNGPLFTNNEFHNTGVAAVATLPPDRGRLAGTAAVLADEFNCRSRWSDASPEQCFELEFMIVDSPELKALRLNARELRQLEAYLGALSGGTAAPAELLRAPADVANAMPANGAAAVPASGRSAAPFPASQPRRDSFVPSAQAVRP